MAAHDSMATMAGPGPMVTLAVTPKELTGSQIVMVESSAHPPEIDAGDLLRINFDKHEIGADGFYALRMGQWTGVRRFARTGSGLEVLDCGAWRPITSIELGSLEVMGRVERVFKSAEARHG